MYLLLFRSTFYCFHLYCSLLKRVLNFYKKVFVFYLILFVLDDSVMKSKKKDETFTKSGWLCLGIY